MQLFSQNKSNKKRFIIAAIIILFIIIVSGCYEGHGLEPEPPAGEIRGQVEFVGQWPDSTREVRVAVLKEYPVGISHTNILKLFNFVQNNYVADSDTIPRGSQYYNYSLELPPGEYAWILVVWFPDISNYFLGVKELGAYYEDPEQDYPSLVTINAGETVRGLDIRADFSNVYNEDPFFKK